MAGLCRAVWLLADASMKRVDTRTFERLRSANALLLNRELPHTPETLLAIAGLRREEVHRSEVWVSDPDFGKPAFRLPRAMRLEPSPQ